jgi:hypothetical protein
MQFPETVDNFQTFTENLAMRLTQHSSRMFQISLSRSRGFPHHVDAGILMGSLVTGKACQAHRDGFCTPCPIGERNVGKKHKPFSVFHSITTSCILDNSKVVSASKPQPNFIWHSCPDLLDFYSSRPRILLPLPHLILPSITSFSSLFRAMRRHKYSMLCSLNSIQAIWRTEQPV